MTTKTAPRLAPARNIVAVATASAAVRSLEEWLNGYLDRYADASAAMIQVVSAPRRICPLDTRIVHIVQHGDAVDAALGAAGHADLIVCAEKGPWMRRLLRRVPRPVLVLPETPRLSKGPVLALVDFSPESLAAARRAMEWGAELGVGVEVLHLFTIPYDASDEVRRRATDRMDQFVRRVPCDGAAVRARVELAAVGGYVAHSALGWIRSSSCSQVFLAARRRSAIVAWLFGFVADEVVRGSDVPVWVIRDDAPLGFGDAMAMDQP